MRVKGTPVSLEILKNMTERYNLFAMALANREPVQETTVLRYLSGYSNGSLDSIHDAPDLFVAYVQLMNSDLIRRLIKYHD